MRRIGDFLVGIAAFLVTVVVVEFVWNFEWQPYNPNEHKVRVAEWLAQKAGHYFTNPEDRLWLTTDPAYFQLLKDELEKSPSVDELRRFRDAFRDAWSPTSAHAALTKSTAAVDEWALVTENTTRKGAEVDLALVYDAVLTIQFAYVIEVASTGTKIEVQISGNSSGNEDWNTLVSFITPTGTPNKEDFNATEPATETTIAVSSTTGYDADETRWIFVKDNTAASSEMVQLVSHVAATSVTIQDGLTNEHTTADTLFNIAETYVVQLPFSANRCRVIYDSTFDVDGPSSYSYARVSKVTGI